MEWCLIGVSEKSGLAHTDPNANNGSTLKMADIRSLLRHTVGAVRYQVLSPNNGFQATSALTRRRA